MAMPAKKLQRLDNKVYEMGLLQHLTELRARLIWIILSFAVCAVASFPLSGTVIDHITRSAGQLVVIHPSEAFFAHLQVSLVMGVVAVSPILLYHLIAFLAPALTRGERRGLYLFLPFGLLLFAGGCIFAFFVVVPFVYRFFLSFTTGSLEPFISLSSYIGFVTSMVMPFGVIFELPLAIVCLTQIGIITPDFLVKNRKYCVFAIFIFAAVLTPPDIISQASMALPLLGLFELSIVLSRMVHRAKKS